jgi:hypothetical protein
MAISIVALSSCDAPPDPRRTNFEIRGKEGVAKYDPKTGRLKRVDADIDKNGRIETFSYWDATRVIRVEVDRDEDGKIDRWEHYTAENTLSRVGSSSRDDQVEDTWTYPDDDGFLRRVEFDADRDGAIDKREIYAAKAGPAGERVLSVVELDFNAATGLPGRRLYYTVDGRFDRSEVVR